MQLTERDREIIRLVHRHRFLRSPQIVALVNDSSQQLLRRLQLLYHHGYLERPRSQIDYYHKGGSRHMVYGLGSKSVSFLKQELGVAFRDIRWGEKNRSVRRIFLEHALLVSDVMVAVELACRESGRIRLVYGEELSLPDGIGLKLPSFRWNVIFGSRLKLGVIPDRVFALDFGVQSVKENRAFFFLEADRGTMPVTRRNLSQTSFYRKLLAYEATWSQSIHRARFGFHRFRVLTVTTSRARLERIIEATRTLERGRGLFLFVDYDSLAKGDVLSHGWVTARGSTERLCDSLSTLRPSSPCL